MDNLYGVGDKVTCPKHSPDWPGESLIEFKELPRPVRGIIPEECQYRGQYHVEIFVYQWYELIPYE